MPNILLAILIVFVAARLLREAMERLRQPGIIGEILAGLLIGPHVLNWIQPGEMLTVLSQLGVMFLLFRIGLEVKPAQILGLGATAVTVAFSGILVSFATGAGIAILFGQPVTVATFIGTAVSATSVVITAEVLSSQGLLRALASQTILAAAVADDVLGLIVFAIVTHATEGPINWLRVTGESALVVAFTALIAFGGHRAARHAIPRMEASMRTSEAQFALSMALLFGFSVLSVYVGVAAIIGAFLAGMALSEVAGERVHTMTAGVSELLVPFFLTGIGMSLDPGVFRDLSTVTLALALLAGAILSKLVGCGAGALGLGKSNALRVGIGMAPRGEVGMVVAQVGRQMGIMPDKVYAIVVFLSVATTLISPPLIRAVFRATSSAATDGDSPR